MFAAGDLVVYGGEGVCRVERVGPSGMAYDDGGRLYYHLTPLYRSGTVLTPVDTGILMRPVITREAALALIASIPMLPPCKPEQAGVRAARDFYHQVVMRCECGELAAMIHNVCRKRAWAVRHGKRSVRWTSAISSAPRISCMASWPPCWVRSGARWRISSARAGPDGRRSCRSLHRRRRKKEKTA